MTERTTADRLREQKRQQNGHARAKSTGRPQTRDEYPEEQRGDAWEPPTPAANGDSVPGSRPMSKDAEPNSFPDPIPASALQRVSVDRQWIWDGCIARGGITLFSALWKAGKTTLLSHLLKALEADGSFCGRAVHQSRVLYFTEESETRWAERRDTLDLGDHIQFVVRPFLMKPKFDTWLGFLDHYVKSEAAQNADLIVLDTLSNLWPVKDENDAAQVQGALMPLHRLTDRSAVLLVHHMRKGDGGEATGTRGSGALPAFVDTILELRRYDASSRGDRRRVLTGYGRWDETPEEIVIELTADGTGYQAHGDKKAEAARELRHTLLEVLPCIPPGIDTDEIIEAWPSETRPRKQRLLAELRRGAEGAPPDWQRSGNGKRGNPFRYWVGSVYGSQISE